ncbi:related to Putative nitrilase-like protein NIT1 [Saccharomycodes ludwigii]|uniref:Related to Putative nitrilase-like protein NIT1 n=1 Tax=Saccharomycodes ludwigii TaxID=36035 RepID=A0A376B1E8_9ASCO|nr:hypothetical protein SCDLUD_001162 [Saccharomycodes ludwigii]KAH3903521.1 hypothetical protein SCDLUD_001162 [Saccharomycodes ludwigii]SSD58462.1 related to Putative nitrilase-like protein NIT1 [Saccharomycodes ludwigii]
MVKQIVAALQVGTDPKGTQATLEKILSFETEIKNSGAKLVVIPEATLGGYPKGSIFGTYLGYRLQSGREQYAEYYSQAIVADPNAYEVKQLAKLSHNTDASLVVGCIEKELDSHKTLYCTMLFIDPIKGYIGKHRKLMPTATERLIWGTGDGSTLTAVDSAVGKIGGAICWENMLPLLRQAMYAKGLDVWCAPTVDQRPIWRSVMQNIAYEGRLFVVSAVQYMPDATKMGLGITDPSDPERKILPGWESSDIPCINGGSIIVNPYGEIIAGPLIGKEGLVTAEIDTDVIVEARYDFDPVGHYARGDVFQLTVNEKPSNNNVSFLK